VDDLTGKDDIAKADQANAHKQYQQGPATKPFFYKMFLAEADKSLLL
jgi:hypothetical protein